MTAINACRIEHVINSKAIDGSVRFVDFIKRCEDGSRWLNHFRYFYEAEKHIEYNPDDLSRCLIHGGKQS